MQLKCSMVYASNRQIAGPYDGRPTVEYNYKVIGHLIDKEEGLVTAKQFLFTIDTQLAPGDCKENDAICLEIQRFDLY